MPKPRYTLVSLDATPYYHCTSRCVRRAFLCGSDERTGQSYEHRRQWIEDKLLELAGIFAVDICAYAVMTNHYHVVLHVDHTLVQAWSREEVIRRWQQLFSGHSLSQRYSRGEALGKNELTKLDESVALWRQRLMDISWFMRVLNESIARRVNAEDDCTGRFWEGRFKSQALLDEVALAACMAYVDLNPVRAGIAKKPESSAYTSIQRRISKARQASQPNHAHQQPDSLMTFAGYPRKNMPKGLPFRLTDYLELVDWTGRFLCDHKKGVIPGDVPSILTRLDMGSRHWLYLTQHFESPFKGLIGSVYKLRQACQKLGYTRTPGLQSCKHFFS